MKRQNPNSKHRKLLPITCLSNFFFFRLQVGRCVTRPSDVHYQIVKIILHLCINMWPERRGSEKKRKKHWRHNRASARNYQEDKVGFNCVARVIRDSSNNVFVWVCFVSVCKPKKNHTLPQVKSCNSYTKQTFACVYKYYRHFGAYVLQH